MELDHLVVTCAELADGRAWVEERLGVPMQEGGRHAAMGTWNALLSLGPNAYLDVIAPDPGAPDPGRPRWFALDRRAGPALTNWMVRTDDLDAALGRAPSGIGTPTRMSRGALSWRVCLPADGELPLDGAFPGLLQWDGAHPAPGLADRGCRLSRLEVSAPDPAALAPLGLDDPRIVLAEGPASLRATIVTPHGPRTL